MGAGVPEETGGKGWSRLFEPSNRKLILAFLLAAAVPELVTMGFGPLSPFLVQSFSLSAAQVGLISSSMAVGSLLFSLPAGSLIDAHGSRPLLMASVFDGGIPTQSNEQ